MSSVRILVTGAGVGVVFAILDGLLNANPLAQRLFAVYKPIARHSAGRWALLYMDAGGERPRAVESACWMLLRRYGIVIRDLLARESNLPTWRELLMGFRRLEDRGEIRGGRFVDGFLGEQFALPIAVESVRAMRSWPLSGETMTLSAADPLNLVGILVPGERVPAVSGRSVSFRDGVAVLAAEQPVVSEAVG
jgi:ATP-dependent Lhr-like helicase